ncbi:MAG: amidohydrolase family protein, partial [Alphaproteobacteria bacterium]
LAMEDSIGNDETMEGLVATGLRLVVAERAADRANGTVGAQGAFERDPAMAAEGLGRIERLHQRWHGAEDGRISVAVSAWAPDLCSPELLRDLRDLQDRLDTVATCHLNQVWGEVAAVKANRGMLPTEYLASTGFLSERLVAAHCRCMTPAEEEIAGKAGISVAFNSCMAARRGLSPNIADLDSHGCTIALGTDNMAEDMVEVMRTAMFMERVRRKDGAHPTPDQALGWATANGYRALGVTDGGVLAQGRLADLIMVAARRAHLVPVVRPVSAFVHNGQAADVRSVMVGGDWIMRDGRVLTMDEDALLAEAQSTGVALWRRMYDSHPDVHLPNGFDPAASGRA